MKVLLGRHKHVAIIFLTLALASSTEAMSADYRLVEVAEGLELPWCVAFLPDGRLLVTERPGRLRQISPEGEIGSPMEGIPEVLFRAQGGLFDVAPHPDFAENRLIYRIAADGQVEAPFNEEAITDALSQRRAELARTRAMQALVLMFLFLGAIDIAVRVYHGEQDISIRIR